MGWMTKTLTLDLLAIAVDGLTRMHDRIAAEGPKEDQQAVSPWADGQPAQPPAPETTQPTPEATPAVQADPEPTRPNPDPHPAPAEELMQQAQTLLRTISQDGGTAWITGVLFPKFGVQSLTNVEADKLPALIADAQAHHADKQAA